MVKSRRKFNLFFNVLREDTHKKSFFLLVGPLRIYPPFTNDLVVHATFGLNVFWLVVRGVYPPYTLSGSTTKKNTFFICVFHFFLHHTWF